MKVDAFLKYLEFEKRFSPHTLIAYRGDLRQLSDFLATAFDIHVPEDIQAIHLRSWMVDLMGRDCASRSVHRKISAVKSWFRYLRKRGHLAHNPADRLVLPKMGKRLPVVIAQEEMEALFTQVAFGEGFSAERDKMAMDMLYQAGLRRSELIHMKISDVDIDGRTLRVMGKGSKERIVPFGNGLAERLGEYIKVRNAEFPQTVEQALLLNDRGKPLDPKQVYNLVRRYLSAVTTVEQRSPHVLRHSFATHLSNNGAELNAVKELLGHSSLAATQVYMHNSIERLRQVYQQAHPKALRQKV